MQHILRSLETVFSVFSGLVLISWNLICFYLLIFFLIYSKECKTLLILLLLMKLLSPVELHIIFLSVSVIEKCDLEQAVIF